MTSGYVYVLSNPAMPGLVKIGRSVNGGDERAKAIYQTGVPQPFVLEFEIFTPNHEVIEFEAHNALDKRRVNPVREFFKCEVAEAIEAVLKAYLSEGHSTGASLVDEYAYHASVDLGYLAHQHGIHWVDVFDCISYLSADAVRNAVDAMREWRARNAAERAAKSKNDQAQ